MPCTAYSNTYSGTVKAVRLLFANSLPLPGGNNAQNLKPSAWPQTRPAWISAVDDKLMRWFDIDTYVLLEPNSYSKRIHQKVEQVTAFCLMKYCLLLIFMVTAGSCFLQHV